MIYTCKCCGKEFEMHKGNAKYCPACRAEILSDQYLYGGYRKSLKNALQKHAEEREKTMRLKKLGLSKVSINEVVKLAMKHGRSYGHEVAVLEGREH